MSNNLSLHEVPVGVVADVEEEKRVMQDKQEGEAPMPKVHLDNKEAYQLAVASMRQELINLVNEGNMTQSVAERLLSDFMFSTFNQLVKLRFE